MITVNQLKMINIAPRGRITGDCVIRALAFICQAKAAFDAIESFVMNEQPHFRPDWKDSGGVYTDKLLARAPGTRLQPAELLPLLTY